MIKAVILETDTPIPQAIKTKLAGTNIDIVRLPSLHDYLGDADYILEYSNSLNDDEIDNFIKRACGTPLSIASTKNLTIREIGINDVPSLITLFFSSPEAFNNDFSLLDESLVSYISSQGYAQSESIPSVLLTRQKELIQQYQKFQYHFYSYGLWLLSLKTDETEVVGMAGFYGSEPVKISYIILPQYRHKGLCSEALEGILLYAHNYLSLDNITAEIDENNLISQHIAAKFNLKMI